MHEYMNQFLQGQKDSLVYTLGFITTIILELTNINEIVSVQNLLDSCQNQSMR